MSAEQIVLGPPILIILLCLKGSPISVGGQERKMISVSQPFFSKKLSWSFRAVAGGVQGAIRACHFSR
jgi:hypothetical protein